MVKKVTVIDYGIGNLFSIENAFKTCGAEVIFSEEPEAILGAERLVLPGVGAFKDGMQGLETRGLVDVIKRFSDYERPFLGICLGMQMMLSKSTEFGTYSGLGIIPGLVKAIENTDVDGNHHKIPHIGWNELHLPEKIDWSGTLLKEINEGSAFYFVHSYTAFPTNEMNRLADSYYGGRRISAVIAKNHLYGTQFHPEKSGKNGLKILKAFLEL